MARVPEHPIQEFFVERWSPRAMSGAPIVERDMLRLIEAARWAPSSSNGQPWRFAWAPAATPRFDALFDLLADGNKVWCARAGALVVLLSRKSFDNGKPNRTHAFDTGSAWMSFALQGSAMGLVIHGMAGFDYDRAHGLLGLDEAHAVECMIAVGHPGRREDLPEPLQAREHPSTRLPAADLLYEKWGQTPI